MTVACFQNTPNVIYDKQNPFLAKLIDRKLLNQPGSSKRTEHIVLSLHGSGLEYECGDSLGVYPSNDPQLVESLLSILGFSGEENILLPKQEKPIALRHAFMSHLSLSQPTKKFLEWLHPKVISHQEKHFLENLLKPENDPIAKSYLDERDMIDLALEFRSAVLYPQDYVHQLKRLLPRLYSIASSPKIYPEEVHLTVAVVTYHQNNRMRLGVASTYLAERVAIEKAVPVFIAKSHFKLPEELNRDIIMIGPGTGIAPYRGFMQERIAQKATGKHWLFFGDQHRKTDYLYGDEWDEYLQKGYLQNLDLAFSRDSSQKIYVQHRMRERGQTIWHWIKNGAYFYVCGDAKRMAKDVDAALIEIIELYGNMNVLEATDYIKRMKKEKRYLRDVY